MYHLPKSRPTASGHESLRSKWSSPAARDSKYTVFLKKCYSNSLTNSCSRAFDSLTNDHKDEVAC